MHVDDRNGPVWLCFLVVVALSAIFLISSVDFYELVNLPPDEQQPPAGAMPPPPAVADALLLS